MNPLLEYLVTSRHSLSRLADWLKLPCCFLFLVGLLMGVVLFIFNCCLPMGVVFYINTIGISMFLYLSARVLVEDAKHHFMHQAMFDNRKELAKYLLNIGVDVNKKVGVGQTPLQSAVAAGNIDMIQFLVDNGVDVYGEGIEWGGNLWGAAYRPLYIAARGNNIGLIKHIVDKGADIHKADSNGVTPLHEAAQHGTIDIVTYLVDNGADIDGVNYVDGTPLHVAAKHGRVDIVTYLVDKGANIDKVDQDGQTPLHAAARPGRVDVVTYLVDKGANIDKADRYGQTPLHVAVHPGSVDVTTYLVDKGADIHKADQFGRTPLHVAAQYGRIDVVTCLVDKGADIDKTGQDGQTPLHAAACCGRIDVVTYLVDKGADIEQCANLDLHFKFMMSTFLAQREARWVVSSKDVGLLQEECTKNHQSICFIDSRERILASLTQYPENELRLVVDASIFKVNTIEKYVHRLLSNKAKSISSQIKKMPIYSLFTELNRKLSLSVHYTVTDCYFRSLSKRARDRLVFLMWCFNKSRLPKEIVLGKIIQYPKEIRMIHYRGVEPSQACIEETTAMRIPHWLEN